MSDPILVRRIPFDFNEAINPVWNPARPEWSHMANGGSLAMPYLEPFLIKVVKEALGKASTDQLKQDVYGFIGQEGQHYQNHRRYNEILKLQYPDLALVEDELEQDYKRFQKLSLRWRLAYTAGFETMTMGITEWLIGQRQMLFSGADPSVCSLLLWHMVEETEHKNVAFDLYQDLYGGSWGGYWARVWGVIGGSGHVALASRKAYIRMLKKDGRWNKLSSRLSLYAMVGRALLYAGPAILRSLLPGYHPGKITDPKWVTHWADAYADLPDDSIPLLDTSDPDIPAQFTT